MTMNRIFKTFSFQLLYYKNKYIESKIQNIFSLRHITHTILTDSHINSKTMRLDKLNSYKVVGSHSFANFYLAE